MTPSIEAIVRNRFPPGSTCILNITDDHQFLDALAPDGRTLHATIPDGWTLL